MKKVSIVLEQNSDYTAAIKMTINEYNCDNSKAIERIGYDLKSSSLFVKFRDSSKIYKYININVPNIDIVLNSNYPKGKLISDIRKDGTECILLNSFPRYTTKLLPSEAVNKISTDQNKTLSKIITNNKDNLKKSDNKQNIKNNHKKSKKKNYKDYSNEWLDVLEKNKGLTIDYLESLIKLLDNRCSPYYPPTIRPRTIINETEISSCIQMKENNPNNIHLYNHYGNLTNEEDGDTVSSIGSNQSSETNNKFQSQKIPSIYIKSIQVRYLKFKIICAIVEKYRSIASQNISEKEYHLAIDNWNLAHQSLLIHQEEVDQLLALLLTYSQYNDHNMISNLPDRHNYKQLAEVLQGIEILINDTEEHKHKTIKDLIIIYKKIQKKLDPLLHDRDIIKMKMGDKWKNNPNRKNNFAETRKILEDEMLNIHETIGKIEALNFNILHDNR